MLPEKERLALQAEVIARINNGSSQSAIAKEAKVSQPAINKLEKRAEVGPSVARNLYAAWKVTYEELLTAHRLRDPAPDADMRVRDFIDWLEGTPAIKALSRRAEVSVKDLLRVKKTPPRGGYADPDEVFAHIVQLRAGEIGAVPAEDRPVATIASEFRRRHGKKVTK